jgi:hypothetical protein
MPRRLLLIALETAAWALALYILTAPPGTGSAAAWHHTAGTCRFLAHAFGRCAIEAESRYWKAVRA